MSLPSSEYTIHVGKVIDAFGLRGEIRIAPMSDVPDRWRTLKRVLLRNARSAAVYEVAGARQSSKGTWLMRLEGIIDRDQAEALKGSTLLVREEDSPTLPQGVYYTHQVIGLQVITSDGRRLGPVSEVLETGANDVYVTPAGLIPAVSQVVKQIDLEAGTMLIEPLPGMLDEDGP